MNHAVEGLKLVEQLKPNVIFLNLTIPIITGLEMLDYFSTQDHYIILTSALEATTVHDRRVHDYLLVPVTTSLFTEAMQRL